MGGAGNYLGSASFNVMIDDNCFIDLPLRGGGSLGIEGMGGR